jgi:hypothetical protein
MYPRDARVALAFGAALTMIVSIPAYAQYLQPNAFTLAPKIVITPAKQPPAYDPPSVPFNSVTQFYPVASVDQTPRLSFQDDRARISGGADAWPVKFSRQRLIRVVR